MLAQLARQEINRDACCQASPHHCGGKHGGSEELTAPLARVCVWLRALPLRANNLFGGREHGPFLQRSANRKRLVFSRPHSMRQTRSDSAISRKIATCLQLTR